MVGGNEGGQTALVLPVPDAEPFVGSWRERFDPSAACGMPAHITVLFPFLSLERVGSDELGALNELFAAADAVPVRFAALGSFPQILYLKPEPATPLVGSRQAWWRAGRKRRLTRARSPRSYLI